MNKFSDLNCEYEVKTEGADVALFSGVASTTDVDSDNDIIEAGAFNPIATKTTPAGEVIPDVALCRDHDRNTIIGGWRSFTQRGDRLLVQGELCLVKNPKAQETYELMKRGYLSGLSVCFRVDDPSHITFNRDTKRRHITKARLTECSIVGFPANRNARITRVKSEINDWLTDHGLNESDLLDLMKDAEKPYGDVSYADPGYQEDGKKRYPIDTERHIRAAWSYIHQSANRTPYSAEELKRIEGRIVAAWKRVIDSEGPPAHQDKSEALILGIDDFTKLDETMAADQLRRLLEQVRTRP